MRDSVQCRKTAYGLVGGIAIGVAFSLALATMFVTSSVMAVESNPKEAVAKISSEVGIQFPKRTLTAQEQRSISLAASRILKHVDSARQAILRKNTKTAEQNVAKAQKLVWIIDRTEPATVVKTEIQSGDETYKDVDHVRPAWITLSDEVNLVDVITPIVSAKAESKGNTPQALPSGKIQSSENPATAAAPEVAYSGVELSAVQFNLNLARGKLERAAQDLKAGEAEDADAALATIQADGVLFSTASADLPLQRASENLDQARWELDHGKGKLAKTLLKAASEALAQHVALLGDKDSKPVVEVQKQIDALAKTLDSTERRVARHMLLDWIDKIENLFES